MFRCRMRCFAGNIGGAEAYMHGGMLAFAVTPAAGGAPERAQLPRAPTHLPNHFAFHSPTKVGPCFAFRPVSQFTC